MKESRDIHNKITDSSGKSIKSRILKYILIVSGTISVLLGIIGIFLPVLPTTPFLLLAAFCYGRSSETFYFRLINNRYLGNYIKNYRDYKAIPLKTKIISVSMLWCTILISAFYFIDIILVRVLLIFIAAAVTYHILSIKTLKK